VKQPKSYGMDLNNVLNEENELILFSAPKDVKIKTRTNK